MIRNIIFYHYFNYSFICSAISICFWLSVGTSIYHKDLNCRTNKYLLPFMASKLQYYCIYFHPLMHGTIKNKDDHSILSLR
jgi:hypothetical protein